MKRAPSPQAITTAKAVLYARVSSKEQEKEGYSIPAQVKLIREYAARNDMLIVREFEDVETAKQTGRTSFKEMLDYLKANPDVRNLLVEKTDRLYRNLRDYISLDEVGVAVHLVKEGEVISDSSKSSAKFMHGIRVLMAKNYVDNLSEEAKKGMAEKAAQGIWPTCAPFGYKNVVRDDGRRIIVTDSEVAPIIRQIFEWYASGRYSLREISQLVADSGMRTRYKKERLHISAIHKLLQHRIYTGEFEWKGQIHQGLHEPIVSKELWRKVQDLLDAGRRKTSSSKHKDMVAFSGLIKCAHCGCSLVGDVKKEKYVYYRCSGFKGKCGEPYVRQEHFDGQFSALLDSLKFDDEVLAWVKQALKDSFGDQQKLHDESLGRLRAEMDQIHKRLEGLYLDKLDGRITLDVYDRLSSEWQEQRKKLTAQVQSHQQASDTYHMDGVLLLELAQNARRLYESQPPHEKRRLLDILVSNCTWGGEEFKPTLKQPFDLIAKTNAKAKTALISRTSKTTATEIWLPETDSNRRPGD